MTESEKKIYNAYEIIKLIMLVILIVWFVVTNLYIFILSARYWCNPDNESIKAAYDTIVKNIMVELVQKTVLAYLGFVGIKAAEKLVGLYIQKQQ